MNRCWLHSECLKTEKADETLKRKKLHLANASEENVSCCSRLNGSAERTERVAQRRVQRAREPTRIWAREQISMVHSEMQEIRANENKQTNQANQEKANTKRTQPTKPNVTQKPHLHCAHLSRARPTSGRESKAPTRPRR